MGNGADRPRDHASGKFSEGLAKDLIDWATDHFRGKKTIPTSPLSYLWDIFTEIFLPGGYGNGPFKIEFRELDAYGRVSGMRLQYWEVKVLRDLSEAYIRHWIELKNRPKGFKPVAMTDTEGLKALFSNAGTKKPKGKPKKVVPPP